jgi:hypothetical protein
MSPVEKKTILEVHLQPGAKSNGIAGLRHGVLQVRVTAPPHKGQANRELLALMAQALAVPKNELALIRGYASRHKLIAIKGLSPEELKGRLAQALPGKELCQR